MLMLLIINVMSCW